MQSISRYVSVRCQYLRFKFVDGDQVAFKLFHLAVAFERGFLAVAFIVTQETEVVAVDEHGVDDSLVPFGRVEFGFGVDAVSVVLLELGPKKGETSADQVVPADGFLGSKELVILQREGWKFGYGEVGCVKIGSDAGKKHVSESGISALGLCLGTSRFKNRGLPSFAGGGLSLE
jgi:hypothetical protein